MPSLERWTATWTALGCEAPPGAYEQVRAAYREPHRAYHTLEHLRECFEQLDAHRALAEHPGEVALAVFLHDAVYDTRRKDSEARSAAWARHLLEAAGARAETTDRVVAAILATQHTRVPATRDEALLVDVDLAILGSSQERFQAYDAQIRVEYGWVPPADYQAGRRAVFEGFLSRPRIYATEPFFRRLEAVARRNIVAALRTASSA